VGGRRFYYVMATFAAGPWARYSPGRLHLEELIRWSIESGLGEFDFTVGVEPFKEHWADRREHLHRYLEPFTARGAVYAEVERTKDRVRELPTLHRLINRVRNRRSERLLAAADS
jgi:CelD/BcsL family acetyltransferase involved in cellulose biosynthesis